LGPARQKEPDLFVKMERLAMMRLLHHYTLSEIKRLVPDAWNLYQNRKWYDERRQALKDFRSVTHAEKRTFFPIAGKQKRTAPKKHHSYRQIDSDFVGTRK